MKSFRFLPISILGFAAICHTFPQNDVDNDVAARYGIQSGNQNSQNHRLPDAPRAPAPSPGPGCRIEYETKYDIVEEESTIVECRQWKENKCTTRQRPKCTPWTDRVCDTKYRQKCRNWTDKQCTDTWRNECSTEKKRECSDHTRPIQVPYEEDECTERDEKRCEKHWEEPIKGKKVWVENPASCKYYKATDCQPVTKYRTDNEKYTKCDDVPYQKCDRVKDTNCRDVPKQECNDVPYQDCRNVQRERCVQESWQDCQQVPKQECKNVHSKVPRQVAKQVPVRVCGNRRETYNDANGQFDAESVFDVRSEDNHGPEDDAETFEFGQQKEQIDPGLFQQKVESVAIKKKGNEDDDDDKVAFIFGDR